MSIIFYVFIFMTYFQTVHVRNLYICNMVLLNEKIKKLRIQKNISQVDMANAAGMSRGAFIAFENGKESVNLSLRAAIEIAKTLNISFNDLFEIEAPAAAGSVDESLLKEKIADLQKQIEQKDDSIKKMQDELLNKNNEFIDEVAFLHNYIETLFNQLIKLAENDRDRKRDEAVKELLQKYIFSLTIKVPDSFNRFKRINEYWKKINEADNFDLNEYVNQ